MKYFIRHVFAVLFIAGGLTSCIRSGEADRAGLQDPAQFTSLRAPAYPLITIDPYTSAWSMIDTLYQAPVRHWTGKVHSLIGAIRVDGEVYRFLGKEEYPLKAVLPMAKDAPWEGSFTTKEPAAGWEKLSFNAKSWKKGKAAFGSSDMKVVNTEWDIDEIWVRREFPLPAIAGDSVYLVYSHDDDFELYLNGTEIVNTGRQARMDVVLKIPASLLNEGGKNVIAAHCNDRGGKAYVDFGIYKDPDQKEVFIYTALQKNVSLSATQTHYSFQCGAVALELRFISPLLPKNLDLLSRPVNYVNYSVASSDRKKHDVEMYFEITPQWAVNEVNQEVEIDEGKTGNVKFLKTGTLAQPVLERSGDNVRIDWGYAYIASNLDSGSGLSIGRCVDAKKYFSAHGALDKSSGRVVAPKMVEAMPALSYAHDLGEVSENATSGFVMIGYDDVESIQYFGDNLKAWWTQDGKVSITDALDKAVAEFDSVKEQCDKFDKDLYAEAFRAGGQKYANLCLLAFRQSIAAHKLTKDSLGNILFLSKENFSNGSIGTVDVTYPSAPLFLKYNPDLLKGMMNPIFYYSESGKWKKPFAAHDVGTYPKANGQTYGEDMPVEECGNMLIMAAAIAKSEGNANYANEHWVSLTTWAEYLLKNGLDPENQLCTDDFAGHLAHNTNLSIKAIMGIASYGMLAEMLNKKDLPVSYKDEAARMAKEWIKMADDGDHYRLTFDQPGTWSQKYNLVWDKLLGFNLFPKEVVDKEIRYYLTRQNKYGLPLDSRRTYTKSDWIVWTATLADDKETFQKFINPLHTYVTGTRSRVPMSDWYETPSGDQVGFQARSVVGGYFIKVLENDK
jgi:hypothetical protein